MKFADQVIVLNTMLNIKSNASNTLTDEIKEWAEEQCFEHKGYYLKTKAMVHGKITCMDCLHEFSAFNAGIETVGDVSTVVCPHCGRKLTIERTRKQTDNQYGTFKVNQIIDGITVTRVFEAHRCRHINQRDEKTGVINDAFKRASWYECVRQWDNGKSIEYSARNISMFEWTRTSPWGNGDITYNRKSSRYSKTQAYTLSYLEESDQCPHNIAERHMQAEYICDIVEAMYDQLKSQAKKEQIIHYVINYPMFETMVKAGYTPLACVIANRSSTYDGLYYDHRSGSSLTRSGIKELLTAAKICIRNKYQIADPVMYVDYMDDLHNLNRDFHNAHYVCPPDLQAAHAQSIKQINAKRRREDEKRNAEERARKVEEAKKHDVEYRRNKHEYLDIEFSEPNQGLRFFVIQSASDMQVEGNKMHHCVGGYWNYPYSLIFSCRRPNNERLATIEVSLSSFKISQTRGVSNSVPEFKDLIEATIMKHMEEIKAAKKRQTQYEAALKKAEEKFLARLETEVDPNDPALLVNIDLGGPCIHGLMAM